MEVASTWWSAEFCGRERKWVIKDDCFFANLVNWRNRELGGVVWGWNYLSLAVLSLRTVMLPVEIFIRQLEREVSTIQKQSQVHTGKGETSRSSQETVTEAQSKSDPGADDHSSWLLCLHPSVVWPSQEVLKSSPEPGVSPRRSQWIGTRKAHRADGVSSWFVSWSLP